MRPDELAAARGAIEALVARYGDQQHSVERNGSPYSELQARTDFIDPLLTALGWDLTNSAGLPYSLREVVVEPSIETTLDNPVRGRPDYTLRPGGQQRLFIEAKRPSIDLDRDPRPSAQIRKYGWTARLGVSVLTNFRQLAFYDTRFAPVEGQPPAAARIPGMVFQWHEYGDRFDELWRLLSRESLGSDAFFEIFGVEEEYRGADSFDSRFLEQMRDWRLRLADAIAHANETLSAAEVGRRTQQLLNSLVFLRVCEDREIEVYGDLRDRNTAAAPLTEHFRRADRRYNAGLFRALDGVDLPGEVLPAVIGELYYPQSPYAFSVVEPSVLGQVYDQFLGEHVVLDANRAATLEVKPEVLHAGGVVPTPGFLVDALLDRAFAGHLDRLGEATQTIRVCDPASGSGIFLVGAYRRLLATLEAALGLGAGFPLARKRELMTRCIFGVDIDDQAVEVTRLALLLALLEDENVGTLADEADPLLPDLSANIVAGNSLIDDRFYGFWQDGDIDGLATVNPLNWAHAFPTANAGGGFDVMVGNPPWIRIQVLSEYFPDQLRYFQREDSEYLSARAHSFDVYLLFVERALSLVRDRGTIAFVLPHRFMTSLAGLHVRTLLGASELVREIVHFGHQQLFPGRTTYACLLVLDKRPHETFSLDLVDDVESWRRAETSPPRVEPHATLGPGPWTFAADEVSSVFDRLRMQFGSTLETVAEIFVGVQTSADEIYFISPTVMSQDIADFRDGQGLERQIERSILRPALRDRRLEAYDFRPMPDAWAIFPYELWEDGDRTRASAIPPERLEREFPLAWRYFFAHRDALDARDVTGGAPQAWYRYGRSQSLGRLDAPKIIVRVLSTTPRYCFDPDGLLAPGGGDGGPYYFIRPRINSPEWNRYLIAILSHPVIDAMVVAGGRQYRGGYFVHRKQFLRHLPIPPPGDSLTDIAQRVEDLQETVLQLRSERESPRKRALERLREARRLSLEDRVSELLRLTPDEVSRFLP